MKNRSNRPIRHTRILLVVPAALLFACQADANVLESTADADIASNTTINTFRAVIPVTDGSKGTVTRVTSPVRVGSHAYASFIPATSAGAGGRRGEIDDNQVGNYDITNAYWYGVSYFVPDDGTWDGNFEQFVGQFRLSNVAPAGGPAVAPSVQATKYGSTTLGGSGHHFTVKNGNWEYFLQYQDPGAASCDGSFAKALTVAPVTKGVWTDFVIQAKWSHLTDGAFRVWMQVNGGGYQLVKEYYGPNWYDTYRAGSAYEGRKVNSPNFTAGLYYGDDGRARTLYVDEVRYTDFPGKDGFDQVKVGGKPDPDNLATLSWTSAIGVDSGSTTYDSATSQFKNTGTGTGFAPAGDNLRFVYVTLDGDGEFMGNLLSSYTTGNGLAPSGTETGIMIRNSLASNAAYLALGLRDTTNGAADDNRLVVRTRPANGSTATTLNDTTPDTATSAGRSFRIVRFNNTVRTYTSVQANARTEWKLISTQTLPLGATTYVGIYTASGNSTQPAYAFYRNVGINRSTGPTPELPVQGASGSNLVARYRLEGNLEDTSGLGGPLSGQNGLGSYSTTDNAEGSQALNFDGVNDYATTATSTATFGQSGDITLAAFIKPTAYVTGKRRTILATSAQNGYRLYLNDLGNVCLAVGSPLGPTTVYELKSQGSVPAGVWSHIAVTLDFESKWGFATFYLNGEVFGSFGVTQSALEVSAEPVYLGARQSVTVGTTAPAEFFSGSLDDVRLYSGALTKAEIQRVAAGLDVSTGEVALADFEPLGGYSVGEVNGQPSAIDTALWTSNPATGGVGRVLAEPSTTNHVLELRSTAAAFTAVRYTPLASDLGLSALTPANQKINYFLSVRTPDYLAGNTTTTHNLTILRDSTGSNTGRALRLAIRRDGRITLVNSNAVLGTLNSSSAWANLEGTLDFGTKTGTISYNGGSALTFPFISDAGTGMDAYGFLDLGLSVTGVRLWLDDLDLIAAP